MPPDTPSLEVHTEREHEAPARPSSSLLEPVPDDRNDVDAGAAQRGVGLGVAVIGEHHARFQGDAVVRTVRLPASGGVAVACGLHEAQLFVRGR